MKVLVTGAAGQLGRDVLPELQRRGHEVCGLTRAECDITQPDTLEAVFMAVRPEAVVHCAAWTKVDDAERFPGACMAVNAGGSGNVAQLSSRLGAKLIYPSTDYVFGGEGIDPWCPEDTPDPVNVYGISKLLGEQAVRELAPRAFIVRTSWLFGAGARNFAQAMLQKAMCGGLIRVVDDQVGSPTYTRDLAVLLADMLETEDYGTYHAVNSGPYVSWYSFARAILAQANLRCRGLIPVTSAAYAAAAARPFNSRMDVSKLVETGFCSLPDWQDALERFLFELRKERLWEA